MALAMFLNSLYNYILNEQYTALCYSQLEHPSAQTDEMMKQIGNAKNWPVPLMLGAFITLLLWIGDIKRMTNKVIGLMAIMMCLSLTGCGYFMKPYQEPVLVDATTSQTPFLLELEGDAQQSKVQTEDYLKSKMIFSRRITVPYRWKQTHRYYMWENGSTGKWIPATRLILVDRSPVTREWTADTHSAAKTNKDQGIWVESKDSIGFSTGITITARIPDDNHAVKFLFNYPPRSQQTIESHGSDPFNVDVARLEEIMDNEIRGRVQAVFAHEAAQMNMDELRESKSIILDKIKEDVIPFFDERGIQITNLGQFGGYTYENPKTQEAIDKVFQAQQDQEVAKAEYNAALERKKALKETGEGEANKILEMARGRAEAVKLEADAKSYEVEQVTKNSDSYLKLKQFEVELKKLEVWDGKLPTYMIESGDKMNTFLPLPNSK